MDTSLRVQKLRADASLPLRAHPGDAGLDLCSCESLTVSPGGRALVPTGIAVEIPAGWSGLICPRSGLALHHGITLLNAPGVIDSGYRGELSVIVHNTDLHNSFSIEVGDRIAQLVLVPVNTDDCIDVDTLSEATRDTAGFGSSGIQTGSAR